MYKLYSLYGIDHSNIFAENRLYRAHGHRKCDHDSVRSLFQPCWFRQTLTTSPTNRTVCRMHAMLSCVIVRVTYYSVQACCREQQCLTTYAGII